MSFNECEGEVALTSTFQPKVSIIMPVYNEASYLEQTFESILSQTYKNIEVLVSDNASEDNTYEILKKYQSQYPQIFKINHFEKQLHAFKNLRRCAEMATGDYVLHFGGDDYLKTNDFMENALKPFLSDSNSQSKSKVAAHFIRLQYINAFTNETICLNPPEYVEEFLHLPLEECVRQFMLETSRDDLFVAVFPRENFWQAMSRTYRFSVESSGWWVVLQLLIQAKERKQIVVYDKQAHSILMKRVQKQPTGKTQSAAGASANKFDKPWFRVWMSLKYSFLTADMAESFLEKSKLLFILLFCPRRKMRGKPNYMPIGFAVLMGAFFWAPLYIRLRDGDSGKALNSFLRKLSHRFLGASK